MTKSSVRSPSTQSLPNQLRLDDLFPIRSMPMDDEGVPFRISPAPIVSIRQFSDLHFLIDQDLRYDILVSHKKMVFLHRPISPLFNQGKAPTIGDNARIIDRVVVLGEISFPSHRDS